MAAPTNLLTIYKAKNNVAIVYKGVCYRDYSITMSTKGQVLGLFNLKLSRSEPALFLDHVEV